MVDIELICPACSEELLLPKNEPNAYECPECDAGLVWNGEHLTATKVDRTFLFVNGAEYDTVFDSKKLAIAVDFANEVMDGKASVIGEFSKSSSSTVSQEHIAESMEFDRGFQNVAIVIFIISLLGFLSLVGQAGLAGCLCLAPSVLIMAIAFGPQNYKSTDLEFAQNAGGSYGVGEGTGFVPGTTIYTRYSWKDDTFTFRAFKQVENNFVFKLQHSYSAGGDNSSPRQRYHVSSILSGAVQEEYIQSIHTRIHQCKKEDLLEDFNLILDIRERLHESIGMYIPIKIEYDGSVKRPSKILKTINNDTHLAEIWKRLEQGY